MTVHGTCAPEFDAVAGAVGAALADGSETGLSLCAVRDGETVVDLWGGSARPGVPWAEDTIVPVFSLSKPMAALAVLLLVDRGQVDVDAPLARYHPGFDPRVLVRHVLGHTAGLSGWDRAVTVAGVLDVPAATERLAAQEPWWEPGSASGYHAFTQGHLLDAVVRGATGAALAEFFASEVAEGNDFHLRTPPDADPRVGRLEPPPPSPPVPLPDVMRRTLHNPVLDVAAETDTEAWRRSGLPSVGGVGNARSVARIQSRVALGAHPRIFETQASGPDLVLGRPITFGLGYALGDPVPGGRVCWWTGFGGSLLVVDPDRRLSVAFVMTRMAPGLVEVGRALRFVAPILEGTA